MGACCVAARYIGVPVSRALTGGGTATNGEEAIGRLRFRDSGFGATV